jgi:hypothetical protein
LTWTWKCFKCVLCNNFFHISIIVMGSLLTWRTQDVVSRHMQLCWVQYIFYEKQLIIPVKFNLFYAF